MKRFEIDLESFCEDIFHEMESIQDGKRSHIVEFDGEDKGLCAIKISKKLVPFFLKHLKKVEGE